VVHEALDHWGPANRGADPGSAQLVDQMLSPLVDPGLERPQLTALLALLAQEDRGAPADGGCAPFRLLLVEVHLDPTGVVLELTTPPKPMLAPGQHGHDLPPSGILPAREVWPQAMAYILRLPQS